MNQQEAVTQIVTSMQALSEGLSALFDIYKSSVSEEPVPAPASDAPTYKLEDVRAVLRPISAAGKREQVQQLLERFGVQKLSDLNPVRFADLIAAAEALK